MLLRLFIIFIVSIFHLCISTDLLGDSPEYSSNPFTFSIPEPVYGDPDLNGIGDQFFAFELNGDGLIDYTFRSETKLYVYDHYGTKLWDVEINNPGGIGGAKHGAADFDGDGVVEIAAINDNYEVLIFNAVNGNLERTITLTNLGSNQIIGHIVIANLRGNGDHDAIIQTIDTTPHRAGTGYYINRTLISLNMENGEELWRVNQDDVFTSTHPETIYEGYWGQAHGPIFCADVDEDSLDEVVGGNMIDHDGTIINSEYPMEWIGTNLKYIDHLDAIAVGDFRPDLPGLEWIVTEEDQLGNTNSWYTTLLRYNTADSIISIVWRKETNLFLNDDHREPQNIAVGNFDTQRSFCEVWVRSRMGDENESQHPWIFDAYGIQFADYSMEDVLPDSFNTHPDGGNKRGIDIIWTIDWDGSTKERITAKARHIMGNIGVFDAATGEVVWHTGSAEFDSVRAVLLYVADVAGDGREELVICDSTSDDYKIRIYWNDQPNPNQPKPYKWDDPLYRRLKQNWNYYSPGSYTYTDYPIISNVGISSISENSVAITWETDTASDSRIEYGESISYGFETEIDTILKTLHSVQLTELISNTTYHFRVKSRNAYKKLGISGDYYFDVYAVDPTVITGITVQESNQVRLTWTACLGAKGYNVYRGTDPNFTPGISNRVGMEVHDEDTDLSGIQWTDPTGVIGDWQNNYFYTVTFIRYDIDKGMDVESIASNRVGEFDYQVITTSTTDFNEIALPLKPFGSDLSNAFGLTKMISNCNSAAMWNASVQGFYQYIPELPFTNFSVSFGCPYFVNVTKNAVFTLVGEIVEPSFSLISGFNEIMLPLNKADITKASELLNDIEDCESIARWSNSVQAYNEQYVPELPSTDFDLNEGYPFFVSVSSNTTWPDGGTPKEYIIESEVSTKSEGSKAPHAVWGKIFVKEDTLQKIDLSFHAFIKSRPEEKLYQNSPGCVLQEGYWIVQCGNFPSPWKADDLLRVEFKDEKGYNRSAAEVTLTYNPVDEAAEITKIEARDYLPTSFEISQNFPNPFNSDTRIRYQLPERIKVSIRIYNMVGQEIRILINKEKEAGFYETIWNGKDEENNLVSSGIYLACMESGKYFKSRKMLFIQ